MPQPGRDPDQDRRDVSDGPPADGPATADADPGGAPSSDADQARPPQARWLETETTSPVM